MSNLAHAVELVSTWSDLQNDAVKQYSSISIEKILVQDGWRGMTILYAVLYSTVH